MAGLSKQGELNVDVLDHDACGKLARWFEERWDDRWCVDISDELVEIIEESWARDDLIPPYHIYLKMAYHLSQEARAGLSEFRIPRDFGNKLFEFQVAAVKIAAHHLNKRGGVLIGDVVGLGKTLMATAVARIFEDDHGLETLIICPKNLVPMWEDYVHEYRLRGEGPVDHPRDQRAARPATVPDRDRGREPQPAKPRGQALPRHSGVHRGEREQGHPALRYALQQDLSGSVQPASPVRAGGTLISAFARNASCGNSVRQSSFAATSARCARWLPSRRASTPTTGAI